MRRLVVLFAQVAAAGALAAQTPDTEIYLATLRRTEGRLEVGLLRNVTNRAGYDNQPHFTRDGSAFLYTARVDDTQTEIFRYDLKTGTSTRVTNTPESEYSATPLPAGGFSVIRVEADSAQRLWRFDNDGRNASVLLPAIKPVGYQAWFDDSSVAMFVLGRPATLRIGDVRTGRADSIAANIARALQSIPGARAISFVQRAADSTLWVMRVDGGARTASRLVQLPAGGEFHAWLPGGALLATSGPTLYEWTPRGSTSWRQLPIANSDRLQFTRIAVSPQGDWVALVGERPATR